MIDEVLAGLKAAADRLDTAVAVATRARADAEQGVTHYGEASRGTGHPDIRAAVEQAREAVAKAGKVGRLLAEAAGHLTGYANVIAPGSAPSGTGDDNALPSGEDLLADTTTRAETGKGMQGFLRKMARNIEDVQDKGQTAGEVAQSVFKIVSDRLGPSGGRSAGTTTPTIPHQSAPSRIDVPETTGNLLVLGVLTGLAIQRSGQLIREQFARRQDDDGKTRAE